MAGEAVLSAFMQVVFDKAFNAARQELGLLRGVNKELNKLSGTLLTIRAVLEDAEEKQIRDPSVRNWLRNLKDIAYDADDLLDEFAARALRSKVEGGAKIGRKKQVCDVFSSCSGSNQVFFRRKMAHKVKAIRERLDEIAKERDNLRLRALGDTSRLDILRRSPTSSLVDELFVFGREEDKEKIVKLLVSERSSSMNMSVIPIVGLGGLGKTTLAQLVYNDPRVEEHFDLRMWVYVSHDYSISRLTRAIVESATREKFELTDLNLLQESLKEKLRGRRFLLVLDDLWNENRAEWERTRLPLAVGKPGSKVLITTRNEKVSETMATMPPYCLEGLSDENCWTLFCKFAFAEGNTHKNPRLEAIGKEIVRKLKGLPLAVKSLGSLLYSKIDETEWENILRSELWELAPQKNDILPALRLSYQDLPSHLKQCFSYCSIFPKGYEFEKDTLIKIWMAQGFIQPQGVKRVEDIGAEYFDDLLSRSFFHYFKDSYVMHDLIHSLAQSVSVDECSIAQDEQTLEIPRKVRHLSLSSTNSKPILFEAFYGFRSLRTLITLRGYNSRTVHVPHDLFVELKYLRVLDFSGSFIRNLPNSIGNLKHLRYLDLTATAIERLPESVSNLYNLQTLKLGQCFSLAGLPRGITNLINLRHLEADTKLISTVAGIGKLTCIQELQEFMVRKETGHRIAELKDMTELRGRLCIWNLENVVSGEGAREAKLNNKKHLRVLNLEWAPDRVVSMRDEGIDEEVLEGLEPHSNLKELSIDGYNGVKFPSWMGNPLSTGLVDIYLYYCRKCKILPSLGQLPFLKYLTVQGLHGLQQVGNEFCGQGGVKGFPSLEVLRFEEMSEWEQWSGVAGQFPCLRELSIKDCPKLRELPNLSPSLMKLEICNAGLRVLPRIWGCEEMRSSNSSSSRSSLSSSSSSTSSLLLSSSSSPSSLSFIYIFNCPNLTSMHEGLFRYHLRDLEDLTIWQCKALDSLPEGGFSGLISLKSLVIEDCPKLMSFPEASGLPTSLINLRIN